jgi:hypothetical protein
MADKLTINLSPPAHSRSTSNTAPPPPFSPRSTTVPDNYDSESSDVYALTPVESPGGPQYDDLPPPSYDEAQRDALCGDERVVLGSAGLIGGGVDGRAHRGRASENERDQDRYRRNVDGNVSVPVPVQYVEHGSSIPVGSRGDAPPYTGPTEKGHAAAEASDQMSLLMGTALEFTRHEPEENLHFAPKLKRRIAIPQTPTIKWRDGRAKQEQKDCRREQKIEAKGRRYDHHISGQWPTASGETLSTPTGTNENGEQSVQFLRAYAKTLHAHSIRPEEFFDFLDGLNALSASSPLGLESDVVRSYLETSNEVFFAPRGLIVRIKTSSALLDLLKMTRQQRLSSELELQKDDLSPRAKARYLEGFIQNLDPSVHEMSGSAILVEAMAERLRQQTSQSESHVAESERAQRSGVERRESEKVSHVNEDEDPPHSIPGGFPDQTGPSSPPFHTCSWRGGVTGQGARQSEPWSPFGGSGNGPFGPHGHGPFGPAGNGPFGPVSHGPFGPPGRGPFNRGFRPSPGCGGPRHGSPSDPDNNDWAAWGQNVGKWGEEFGKRMGAWGEELGKRAEVWGNDLGRRSEAWGEQIAAQANVVGGQSGGSAGAPDVLRGQESGVTRGNTGDAQTEPGLDEKSEKAKVDYRDNDDDDDASSISSDSDSDSSDSESENGVEDPSPLSPTEAYHHRVSQINATATAALLKGKKSTSSIEHERNLAMSEAFKDRASSQAEMDRKRALRSKNREFKDKKRDLKQQWRQMKRDLKTKGVGKKGKEWKEGRKTFRDGMKGVRRERANARKEAKGERRREKVDAKKTVREERLERRSDRREERRERRGCGRETETREAVEEMLWIVVENLE